jgi:hypothetical protein
MEDRKGEKKQMDCGGEGGFYGALFLLFLFFRKNFGRGIGVGLSGVVLALSVFLRRGDFHQTSLMFSSRPLWNIFHYL